MNNNDDRKLGRHIVFEDDTEMEILKDYTTGIYTQEDLSISYGVSMPKVRTITRELGGYKYGKRKNGIRGIVFLNDKF